MAFVPHLRRDAQRQPRSLALLAVLLLHAGCAAGLLLPRPEGASSRGAAAEPPMMVLVNIAAEVTPQAEPALPEHTPPAVAPPPLAAPAPVALPKSVGLPSAPAQTPASAAVLPSAPPVGIPQAPGPVPVLAPAPAPPVAAAPPSHQASEVYQKILWQQVASRRPQGIHLEGEAVVAFTLDRAGRLLSARIAQTSGNKLLDRLALRTVRTAAPFPPPPIELTDEALHFSLAFNFR